MESMTKILPTTVTKLSDPVTRAMKTISMVLYWPPASCTTEEESLLAEVPQMKLEKLAFLDMLKTEPAEKYNRTQK